MSSNPAISSEKIVKNERFRREDSLHRLLSRSNFNAQAIRSLALFLPVSALQLLPQT
jgi:hypothetical protein